MLHNVHAEYVHAIGPFSISFALLYCWNMLVLSVLITLFLVFIKCSFILMFISVL